MTFENELWDNPNLAVFSELPREKFWRMSIALLVVVASIAAAYSLGSVEVGSWAVSFGFALLALASRRIGGQRMLVFRSHDFFTVRGDADQPVLWSAISGIEITDDGVELTLPSGARRRIRLRFLPIEIRWQAMTEFAKWFDCNRALGPPRLGNAADGSLKTDRLTLRWFAPEDRRAYASLLTSGENRRSQLNAPITERTADELFDRLVSAPFSTPGYWHFAIEIEGTVAGNISLVVSDFAVRHADLGIDLLPEFWNRGIGTEATRTLLRFVREQTNLACVLAGCFSDNIACQKVLENAGMKRVGEMGRFFLKNGEWKTGYSYQYLNPSVSD
ncbi:MAG: GNAT family N-acetyltransferase [Akkermansiaceae bacterium]|nr:GNAT family N-acetyltransferase [Akkermansiaceae bacterium]